MPSVAPPPNLRFDDQWCEDVTLDDGRCVRFRLLRPTDADKLQEGIGRLSERSRYLRFFTDKPRLTSNELQYLTQVDQYDHFAIAAGLLMPDGTEGPGVGIGRFVRLPDEPEVADPAVAVVDEMQGHGIGRRLMTWLIGAAAERGIRTFRTELLAVNVPMKQLLSELSDQTRFSSEGPVVIAEFPLPVGKEDVAIVQSPQFEPMLSMLRLSAQQAVELVSARLSELLDPDALRARLTRWASRLRGGAASEDD